MAPTRPGRQHALFTEDAFKFDFSDDVPVPSPPSNADEGNTAASLLTTTTSVARSASARDVKEAWSQCIGAGAQFIAVGSAKEDWASLRQRHRDCVARALKSLRAAKKRASNNKHNHHASQERSTDSD